MNLRKAHPEIPSPKLGSVAAQERRDLVLKKVKA